MTKHNITLIINYAGMQTGGIETYFSKLMLYAIEKRYRVIWLTNHECIIRAHHLEIANSVYIEKVIVDNSRFSWFKHEKLSFLPDEKIIMLSCDPFSFIRAEKLRREIQNVNIFFHFLVLPHFKGFVYYPERGFGHNPVRFLWFCYMRKLVRKLEDNNCLRAFSLKHLECYEDNYRVKIKDKERKVLQSLLEKNVLDSSILETKTNNRDKDFNIVTCSRFDFPHKGYLLGLIDKFAEIKKIYPQTRLTIIGYGDGYETLFRKINDLVPEIKKDINLTGQLPLEEVELKFKYAHLNIGLGGALGVGARCGVPSLLVRHYSDTCETYGFISSTFGNLLRDDAGYEIDQYIIRVIKASPKEYLDMCYADYNSAWGRVKSNPDYIFEQSNKSSKAIVSYFDDIVARVLVLLTKLKFHFLGQSNYDFEII